MQGHLAALFCAISIGIVLSQEYIAVTKDANGVWWWTQNGKNFLSLGVNHVNNGGMDDGVGGRERSECHPTYPLCGDTLSFGPKLGFAPYYNTTMARWGSESNWAKSAAERLRSWGFNTVSGWSATIAEQQGLYYAHLLDIITTWQQHVNLPDLWSQETLNQVDQIAKAECAPRATDKNLIGYQTDNELYWEAAFLQIYLKYNSSSGGFARVIQFLTEKYKDIATLNRAWNITAVSFQDVANHLSDRNLNQNAFKADQDDFQLVVATQYFKITTAAIKKYDQNHLILGARFSGLPANVIKALIPYVDVIDQHGYDDLPPSSLASTHQLTGKPVYVGEFSFTAIDSNMPNSRGARAGNPFATQTQRAAAYIRYVTALLKQPYALGYHWWQWADEPSTGRWPDGEDSNYGVVSICDDPYQVLTEAMTTFNAQAQVLHASSGVNH